MRIFKLIKDLLEAELMLCVEKLREYKLLHSQDTWNIEAGRAIEEISNLYPASYKYAVIIFEEWCKGLLTECRPSEEQLREYARFTADSNRFHEWHRNRKRTVTFTYKPICNCCGYVFDKDEIGCFGEIKEYREGKGNAIVKMETKSGFNPERCPQCDKRIESISFGFEKEVLFK